MKIYNWVEQWDYHKSFKFIIMEDNIIVASGAVEELDEELTLVGGWVIPKYRGLGYGKILVDIRLKVCNDIDKPLFTKLKKDNPHNETLKKTGFEFYDDDDDEIYHWLKRKS